MEYGIPILRDNIISEHETLGIGNLIDDKWTELVSELGENATISTVTNGGDDGSNVFSINQNDLNISKIHVSWESLIGVDFSNMNNVPSISTKWKSSWGRMYYSSEPHLLFCIKPLDNNGDLGMYNTKHAYSNNRVLIYAFYHFRDGNANNNFKWILDITPDTGNNNMFGLKFVIYYQSYGNNLNPYTWAKIPLKNNQSEIEVVSYDRIGIRFNHGSNTLSKNIVKYKEADIFLNNIKMDYVKTFNAPMVYNLSNYLTQNKSIVDSNYYRTNKYEPILNTKLNSLKLGLHGDIEETVYPSEISAQINNISFGFIPQKFKGFIEGKPNDEKIEARFIYRRSYEFFKTINTVNYDFSDYINMKDISILVDGRLRHIDIDKPMIKGYISGKVNTSGCSGQDFLIKCYRHSNGDYIGGYSVDDSGNYFIPNLNYLDEYDIMLVDKNSVIETKVSSKRKPILNDEIKELKLQAHMSNTGYDVFSKIKYKSLLDTYGVWIWNLASTMATENVNFLKDIRNPDYETLFENTEDFCFYNYKHVTNSWSSDTGWVNNFLIDKSPIGKVFEVHLYNGTYSYTCADTHLEFKDDDDNIIAVMKFERDSSYQSGIWYGTSWNTITKASQSGSYPQTTGILEFHNDKIVYTNTRTTGGWNRDFIYNNPNLYKVTKINVLKARAYMDYPNTHTQFRMVEIELE